VVIKSAQMRVNGEISWSTTCWANILWNYESDMPPLVS